ncbi:MAG: hypothetical protein ACN6NL_05950 [Acinetobacter sp.]
MDDLEEVTKYIDVLMQENPLVFLGENELKAGHKLLIMDLLINFNKLEVHLKRLVTYMEIATYKGQVKTLPLAQLMECHEIQEFFTPITNILFEKIKKNLYIRNLIAHSIPSLIDDKYIVFLSHDISELRKIRANLTREDYKYSKTQRTKVLLRQQEKIDHSNFSVMRFHDLIRLNEMLDDLIEQVESIVNKI